ncbi:hypothetical protein ACHHYP_01365 [Achlya hypogyna]|uniref:UBR-type domain-containing protein n=1 Tax=Achlya hypogyna TaxID=1202772 RepID=A0A1V9ZTL6_ACHHY|nr:hypothetical protein ACHHYP_01365 [Achlya hypogyna]
MAETGGGNEVELTLEDVLREDASLAEEADAVFGAASATQCSYEMGYMRQALYACLTCSTDANPAGICLACSLACHADHDLVELYTKRHFRCDCGTTKFDSPCSLYEGKDLRNDENVYSQNFSGLYCSCHRPYPDPERTSPEVMIQCVVCEDWFHEEHLFADGKPQLPEGGFDECVCPGCMTAHPFIYHYVSLPAAPADASACRLPDVPPTGSGPTFWPDGWRAELCRCPACAQMYAASKISFLVDQDDTLIAYEARAKENAEDVMEAGDKAFQSELSHTQQVEMALGYERMASSLKDYLAGFAQSGQTVKAEDIHGFFDTLRNKRQKRE